MEIKLPQLSYFHQIQDNRPVRNKHSGSLGTDPEHGAFCTTTFNYKVYADDAKAEENTDNPETTAESTEEEKIILIAECYIQLPWSQGLECKCHNRKAFSFSVQGLADIALWLNEQYAALMP